jgi:hypothetical protein
VPALCLAATDYTQNPPLAAASEVTWGRRHPALNPQNKTSHMPLSMRVRAVSARKIWEHEWAAGARIPKLKQFHFGLTSTFEGCDFC